MGNKQANKEREEVGVEVQKREMWRDSKNHLAIHPFFWAHGDLMIVLKAILGNGRLSTTLSKVHQQEIDGARLSRAFFQYQDIENNHFSFFSLPPDDAFPDLQDSSFIAASALLDIDDMQSIQMVYQALAAIYTDKELMSLSDVQSGKWAEWQSSKRLKFFSNLSPEQSAGKKKKFKGNAKSEEKQRDCPKRKKKEKAKEKQKQPETKGRQEEKDGKREKEEKIQERGGSKKREKNPKEEKKRHREEKEEEERGRKEEDRKDKKAEKQIQEEEYLEVIDKVRGCLWSVFIADALSMPVHWEYNPSQIKKKYGTLDHYVDPPSEVSNTIMYNHWSSNKHNAKEIIGSVINHGKDQFWSEPYSHFHRTLQAGENTLNVQCVRVMMRTITQNGGVFSGDQYLENYIQFMTTEGTHNDTYAEAFHRQFFANFALHNKEPRECAGEENHDTANAGAFCSLAVLTVAAMGGGPRHLADLTRERILLTHKSDQLCKYSELYTSLLASLLVGEKKDAKAAIQSAGLAIGLDLKQVLEYTRRENKTDEYVVSKMFGAACYLSMSFPCVLFLAYKYVDDFEGGIVANTNAGGDNCGRGVALGALLGAVNGMSSFPDRFVSDLHHHHSILTEIDDLLEVILPHPSI